MLLLFLDVRLFIDVFIGSESVNKQQVTDILLTGVSGMSMLCSGSVPML